MANTETNVTKWTELSKTNDMISDVKYFIISKMKEHFEHYEDDGITYFKVNAETIMHICILRWEKENCLVMSYHSPHDSEDGDQFYISDYATPNDMLEKMLEEANY